MIPNADTLILFRFSEQQWADSIINGNLSFSCPGAFICQAKISGNTEQGDLLEGVFARLKNSDVRIDKMQKQLGKDLELIEDGAYCFLRRKSAKLKPIFCMYSYTARDALEDGNNLHMGECIIRHTIDDRMATFFIEPTCEYSELFYKHPRYRYQHEARICMKDMKLQSYFDRFSLEIGKLAEDEYKKLYTPVYLDFDVVVEKSVRG